MRAAALTVMVIAVALAGCSDGRQLFPTMDASAEALSLAAAPGIVVTARVTGGGEAVTFQAHAENRGPHTWRVPAQCTGPAMQSGTEEVPRFSATEPWSIAARYPDDSLTSRDDFYGDVRFPIYPAQGCREVSLRDFPPGAVVDFTVPWDGSFYSPYFGRYVEVFPGGYLVDVALELYTLDEEPIPLVATLSLRVLDTG
jgi:hypothetical protein